MIKVMLIFLCSLAIVPAAWASPTAPANTPAVEPLDKVVATVNNDVITQNELNLAVAALKQQLQQQNIPSPGAQVLQQQVLQRIIYNRLQLQLAKKGGIEIPASKLNQAIADIAKRNGVTVDQLRTKVEASGTSYPEYRQQIRDQMTVAQLQQMEVGRNITVSDQEVAALIAQYQQKKTSNHEYRVRDILIALPDVPTPSQIEAAKQKAETLVAQLQKGENFQKTAIAHSSGQQAFQGGDLGWRKLAELPTPFAAHVTTMKTGDIAGPIQTPNGFHIIKLTNARAGKGKSISKTQAQQMIYKRKFNQQLQSWLQNLRETAFVKIN